MNIGKMVLAIILLVVITVGVMATLGRTGRRAAALAIAALCASFALLSVWLVARALLRGYISLAKHGGVVTYSLSDSPVGYLTLVLLLLLFATAMFGAAVQVMKFRRQLN